MLARYVSLSALVLATGCLGAETPTTILPPAQDRCAMPIESGPCEAAIPRWAFDPAADACVQFTYGGCGGNDNSFESQKACESSCDPQPVYCGGWSGDTCAADEFCDFQGNGCDWADASGTCKARPTACDQQYLPVCGCDGQTYSNNCAAQAAGSDQGSAGVCSGPCSNADCGPAPGAPNFMCDDGSTGGPVCGRSDAGICQWTIQECPVTVGGCPDASRDPIVLGGRRSFGFCAGDCDSVVQIGPSPLDAANACDVVSVEVCDHGRTGSEDCTTSYGTLTRQGHDEARAAAIALQGLRLLPRYGCPDCADGGASEIEVMRDGTASTHVYEFNGPPVELEAADALVQGLIDDLRACTGSARVQIDGSCVAR